MSEIVKHLTRELERSAVQPEIINQAADVFAVIPYAGKNNRVNHVAFRI